MTDKPTPRMDEVICPQCCHQFMAIPHDVQCDLSAALDGYNKFKERLNPSIEYVDGTPVGYGEDEIDRLEAKLSAALEEIERLRALLGVSVTVVSEAVAELSALSAPPPADTKGKGHE